MCGRLRVGKENLHEAGLVGAPPFMPAAGAPRMIMALFGSRHRLPSKRIRGNLRGTWLRDYARSGAVDLLWVGTRGEHGGERPHLFARPLRRVDNTEDALDLS